MAIWDRMKRTVQRDSKVFTLDEIPSADGEKASPLVPERDYLRVWLSEMFLGTRSTLIADWLPAAHAQVSVTRAGGVMAEYTKVFRPDPDHLAQGAKLNYALTDLLPYKGGVVEIEAALVAWQETNRVSAALDVLQFVSTLPIPPLAPALAIAGQVTQAAKTLVDQADGSVHLDMHQAFVSATDSAQQGVDDRYIVGLLADENEVSPGTLRVVDSRLHQLGADGQTGTCAAGTSC